MFIQNIFNIFDPKDYDFQSKSNILIQLIDLINRIRIESNLIGSDRIELNRIEFAQPYETILMHYY